MTKSAPDDFLYMGGVRLHVECWGAMLGQRGRSHGCSKAKQGDNLRMTTSNQQPRSE